MITFLLAKFNYSRLYAGTDGSPQVASFLLAIQVWVLGQHVLGNGNPARTRSALAELYVYLEEPFELPISVMASLISWR